MIDLGIRCDRHTGEVFAPRCFDCLTAQLEARPKVELDYCIHGRVDGAHCPTCERASSRPTVNGQCALHPGYPVSDRFACARCEREREAS